MAARKRFCEICIQLGFTSKKAVARALEVQKELQAGGMEPPLVGEILVREGFITPEQRDQALEAAGEIPADFIPGYEIIGRIGRGARGIVYKARQVSMDRLVALKILPRTVAEDRKYTERFTREAKSVARLNHPNIISGIDVGEHEGCHYFVMEYVDGTSLATVLRSGPQPVEKGIEIARQVAGALDHAHSHGIVHRDIKPDNIMVTREGSAKLCDYGLAGQVTSNPPGQRLKKVEGTPHYISPEQAKGLPDIDIRSDLYSMGATIYHVVTGAPPFDGGDAVEIMRKHVSEKPPPMKERVSGIRPSFQRLVDRLLEKDREKRFQTPREVLDAIAGLSKGPRRGLATEAAPALTWREKKRRQIVGAGMVGLALAVLLGGALILSTLEQTTLPVEPAPTKTATRPPVIPATGPSVVPEGTTPPKEQPDTQPLTREEREAKEAWERIIGMVTESKGTIEETKNVMVAMEGFISKYEGSALATQAAMMLTHQELAYEKLLGDEFDALEMDVEVAAGKGKFREAADMASDFQEKYDNPSYTLKASNLVREVEKANEAALEEVEKKAKGLVDQKKYTEASALYSKLEERSTVSVAERCREKAQEIESILAKESRRARLDDFLGSIVELIRTNRFDDAIGACDAVLGEEEEEEVITEVEKQKEILGRMAKTYRNLLANLEAKKDKAIDFTLSDGTGWQGKILRVEQPSLRLTVKVTGEHGEVSVELSRLSAEMLAELSQSDSSDGEDDLNGAIFFLAKENYPPAKRLFDKVHSSGGAPDWVVRDIDVLKRRYRESEADRLLTLAKERMDQGAWKAASKLLKQLTEELADTEAYGKAEASVRRALRTCAIEILDDEGPQALLQGEVEKLKKDLYSFTYDFTDEKQIEDWTPDTTLFPSAFRKLRGDTMEVLGKVDFRVQFLDDIQVVCTVESRAIKNPNINILLNDGARTGYLFALGFKPKKEWISLEIPREAGQANRRVLLPANAILRWTLRQEDPTTPPELPLEEMRVMGLWGEMKPVAEVKKKYKVKVAHAEGTLQFGALVRSRDLVRMEETSDGDRGGGVAFVPFGSTMLLHKVEITGRPDPEWLKNEAARQVDKLLAGK